MNITKLIKPLKIVSAVLVGIASLGLLVLYIINFASAFEVIKNNWSGVINYILYFIVLAGSAFYSGRAIYMLIKNNEEKYNSSVTESVSTFILFPFWVFIDVISLYSDSVTAGTGMSFPVIPLIGGIFAFVAFVCFILAEVKKFSDNKKKIFALVAIISAVLSILMTAIAIAVETLALVFLIVAMLGIIVYGFIYIRKYFIVKEEPKIEETKVEEKSE